MLEGTAVDDSVAPEAELVDEFELVDEAAVVEAWLVVDEDVSCSTARLIEPRQNTMPATKKSFR